MKRFVSSRTYFLLMGLPGSLAGFGVGTYVSPRSSSVDAARELVGWQREINRPNAGANYWSFCVTPEYVRSFNNCRIADYLMGGTTFSVVGSAYGQQCQTGCGATLLADYFGLPRDFKSTVQVRPTMSEFLMDFDFYYGLDDLCTGLYARLHMPLVHANWNLNLCEAVSLCGTATFPAGYMAATDVARNDLPCSFTQAIRGETTFGDMAEPLRYGKIYDRQITVHVSDVQAIVGYNFLLRESCHAGFNLRVSLPTGTRNCQFFLFEPVIGNGHHGEIGAGFTTHYDVWSKKEADAVIGLYADFNVTHLCSTTTRRSYNFIHHGPGSRYMLLERIYAPSTGLFFADTAASGYQYAGELVNAINRTTLCSKIKVPIQADLALKAAISWGGFTFDIGYNFWGRSREHLVCREPFANDTFALKGDAQIYGFTQPVERAVPLGATQNNARLCAGQGMGNADFTNANADNPVLAFSTGAQQLMNLTVLDAALIGVAQVPVNTSGSSLLLSDSALDTCSGLAPRSLSHAVFFHLNYTWKKLSTTTPYFGGGGKIEYAHGSLCCNGALSTWGVWIKGGFSR